MHNTVILPLLPVYVVDFLGSTLMIVFAVVAFYHARRLIRLDPHNVLWTHFFWVCMALIILAASRGTGHLLRYILMFIGHPQVWTLLSPYSGGFNSLAFCAIAVLTFYYHDMRAVIERVRNDSLSLEQVNSRLMEAHAAMRRMNLTLEQQVERRTHDLRLSEEKFRGLFEGSQDMIYFCDRTGNICDINPSGLELLGIERREEIIGQSLADFFLDMNKWNHYRKALDTQGHVRGFEVELVGKKGNRLYTMLTASAIKSDSGFMQGCEGIAKDLTHFKEMMEQLVQSEKMTSVGQLAAGVAHEINTPLGIILGYTQLLEEDFEKQPEVLEPLQTIEKQAKVCRRIVADLLKFSRQTAEHKKFPADINKCLADVISIVEHTLNLDHIYIHHCFSPDLPEISFDYERMRQVFVNLLNNAHHAIGKEGIIGVWTRFQEATKEVEIVVADSGTGIPPELQGRIFDPFFTTKGAGKGTGLGLSVSFGIIQDHGGRIEVQSPPRDPATVAAGMHTSFHIFLPALPANSTEEG
jgi:PAS domain S-box-containing protein